jgi:predicted transposase/invertase (TIGR01784 family)
VKALCEHIPEIKEAKEIYEHVQTDPKAREMLRLREKSPRDQVNALNTAKKLSKAEGLIEGELKKAKETAIRMLGDGMSITTVSKYTGLSIEEIKELIS